MAGLVFGAVVGAGLVMLLAPRSGAETRQLIQERADAILAEGRRAAEERRLELTAQLEALKET
jgi:gas vesicle protein